MHSAGYTKPLSPQNSHNRSGLGKGVSTGGPLPPWLHWTGSAASTQLPPVVVDPPVAVVLVALGVVVVAVVVVVPVVVGAPASTTETSAQLDQI